VGEAVSPEHYTILEEMLGKAIMEASGRLYAVNVWRENRQWSKARTALKIKVKADAEVAALTAALRELKVSE
jgi:hypothetical protein